jgi:hypothetical protein
MANHDEILLRTGLPPDRVARRLAEVLHATLRQESDTWVVYRKLASRDGTVGGSVMRNRLRQEPPGPRQESVYDGYDTIFDIWATYQHEDTQRREAQALFSEIINCLPWPAAHVDEGGLLFSAWDPELGRTDFPEQTGAYADGRDLWQPYVDPAIGG